MFRAALALAVLFVCSPASAPAQTVERTIDLSALGWGTIEATPAETDGNTQTEEWVAHSYDTNQWRVVAVRPEGLCAGPWFLPPGVGTNPFIGVEIITVAGRSKLKVSGGVYAQTFTLIALSTPDCQP